MSERYYRHWAAFGRLSASVYNPWPDEFCFSLHTCNHTLMFEVPGLTIGFYFGRKIDD